MQFSQIFLMNYVVIKLSLIIFKSKSKQKLAHSLQLRVYRIKFRHNRKELNWGQVIGNIDFIFGLKFLYQNICTHWLSQVCGDISFFLCYPACYSPNIVTSMWYIWYVVLHTCSYHPKNSSSMWLHATTNKWPTSLQITNCANRCWSDVVNKQWNLQ